jgi:hypothetical protein
MKKIVAILLVCLFFQTLTEEETLIIQDKTIKDMKSSLWNSLVEGFYLLNDNIIPQNHTVIAFSSLNNTGYTDIITYVKESDNNYIFYKHLYDKEKYEFSSNKNELFRINDSNIASVRNLFVGKFYGDHNNYCYLASFNIKDKDDELLHYIKCGQNEPEKMLITSNILILNRNENDKGQILFSGENGLKICLLDANNHLCNQTDNENIQDFKVFDDKGKNISISLKGGMAYVDVDGNCRPDIILSYEQEGTRFINVYLSNRRTTENYTLAQTITVGKASEYGSFIISRINNTKSYDKMPQFDIFIPKLDDTKIIVYENQIKIDYKWDTYHCKEDEGNDDVNVDSDLLKNGIFKLNNNTYNLESDGQNAKFEENLISMIRPGDFSAEGQLGLLVKQKSGDKTIISLFSKDEEKFNLQLKINGTNKIGNPIHAVFYDINEAGLLGLIVQNDKLQNFFIYNFRKDKYFLKAKLMNDRKALYDANIGASFRFIVTSKDGSRHMDISCQLAQTSDMSIPLPYSLMGLGETNNYVENFQILSGNYYNIDKNRYEKEKYRNFRDQTPLIPNTQMAIFKFINDKNRYEWYIDLYILPTDTLLVIALSIIGFMLVILGVIIYLHVREVKEEQKETNKFKSWFA